LELVIHMDRKRTLVLAVVLVLFAAPLFGGCLVAKRWNQLLAEYRSLMSEGAGQSAFLANQNGTLVFVDSACGEEFTLIAGTGEMVEHGEVDKDGDGLNRSEEFVRLTSDCSEDSDRDGIPDAEDIAPNAYFPSSSSSLWEVVLREHIGSLRDGPKPGPAAVHIHSPFGTFSHMESLSFDGQLITHDFLNLAAQFPTFLEQYASRYSITPLINAPGLGFLVEVGYIEGRSTQYYRVYGGIELPWGGFLIIHRSTD
jgi:hypothetical protein